MSDAVANRDEHRGTKLDSLPDGPFCDERPDLCPDRSINVLERPGLST
jgi:hypothetical protein